MRPRAHPLALFMLVLSFAASAAAQTKIVNHESAGNLAPTHSLDCIPADQVKNEYTPADLYPAVRKCMQQERYENALDLFMIAGAYAYFDKLRVVDKTAHQGAQILVRNSLLGVDAAKKKKLELHMNERAKPDSKATASLCTTFRRIGPPNYHPTYMIQHGMGAFTGEPGEPLVTPFDAQKAFETALDKYVHCPK